jgi:EmrB/QacA subfamily drug resistance transporter
MSMTTDRRSGADRKWWILAVLGVAQLMVTLDATIVNIALPSAQHALGFDNGDRQWVVTAYALSFGSLLLLGGRLGNLFGVQRVFIIGLAGFAISSAVGGAADGFGMLVAARAAQGAFGAIVAPTALSLLSQTFTDPRQRARAFGVFGAIAGSGAAFGLIIGGVLTEYLSWRWCMYVNLVFAGVAIAGASTLLRGRNQRVHTPLDIPGVLLVSTGLFSLVYGFSHAETGGWSSPVTVGFLAAAAVLLISFVITQTRVANPLLPLRVVLNRNRGGAYLAIFTVGVGMFGVFLFLTYYLQQTLGYSAVQSGLAFLPMTGAVILMAQIGTNVLTRWLGPRWLIGPGLVIAALGMWMLNGLDLTSSYTSGVLPAVLVFGAGLGLTFSSAMNTATAGVRPEDSGVASAMVNTGQQVGGSVGTSLLNTIAATSVADYIRAHPSPNTADPTSIAGTVAQATMHSYTVAFNISAAILLAGGVIAAIVLRSTATEPIPAADGAGSPARSQDSELAGDLAAAL